MIVSQRNKSVGNMGDNVDSESGKECHIIPSQVFDEGPLDRRTLGLVNR